MAETAKAHPSVTLEHLKPTFLNQAFAASRYSWHSEQSVSSLSNDASHGSPWFGDRYTSRSPPRIQRAIRKSPSSRIIPLFELVAEYLNSFPGSLVSDVLTRSLRDAIDTKPKMKRFTATEKWGKEWYQALKPKMKCLWQFICDHADACGAWEPNFGLASYQIGERITAVDMKIFGDRVALLPNGKYLVISFIEFQYGKLSDSCPAHKPVFRALEKNRVSIPYQYPTGRVQEEEEEEEEDKKGKESPERKPDPAETIYTAYPKKTGRAAALKYIRAAMKTVSWQTLLEKTIAYADATGRWPPADRQYIPDPERWYRKGRWDDDPATWSRTPERGEKPADTDEF